jgi:hypothetical protein
MPAGAVPRVWLEMHQRGRRRDDRGGPPRSHTRWPTLPTEPLALEPVRRGLS